jgi:hypothetical protein
MDEKLKEDLGALLWNDLKKAIAAECVKNNVRFIETDKTTFPCRVARTEQRFLRWFTTGQFLA